MSTHGAAGRRVGAYRAAIARGLCGGVRGLRLHRAWRAGWKQCSKRTRRRIVAFCRGLPFWRVRCRSAQRDVARARWRYGRRSRASSRSPRPQSTISEPGAVACEINRLAPRRLPRRDCLRHQRDPPSASADGVGAGKTALVEQLALAFRERVDLAVVTNDIYTQEDAQNILVRSGCLPGPSELSASRPAAVRVRDPRGRLDESAGDDAELEARFPGLQLVIVESGGDRSRLPRSAPTLPNVMIYLINITDGGKDPCQRRPRESCAPSLLIINKIDLAPYVRHQFGTHAPRWAMARGDGRLLQTN